ncbi:MAG: arylamine N-acetyltransferase, partial [Burkholderiales bacterium]|nr:arylamine N-acetyltransferase [Burkholderiales bacterium]
VPFENLDIHLGKRIVLSETAILDKLLRQGRGGFCYELNYGFAYLLRQIGFSVDLLSARVFNGQSYGPEFDHMLLLVRHRDQAWIADVGFGECFRTPLTLDGAVVSENGVVYKIVLEADGQYVLLESKQDEHWKPQYQFRLTSHNLSDFDAMCAYQQNSPLSHFTQKSLCSIATNDGRLTISNGLFISTKPESRTESPIPSVDALRQQLQQQFGIVLSTDDTLEKLLPVRVP